MAVWKKKCLLPRIENENDTYLVYEVKFPFPLGVTQYHREIWNTTSLTACSDNTALLRGWERSELQNLHLKDWAVTSLLQADNKKCPWKPFLCLSNSPWAKKALEDVNYKGQANMAQGVIILSTLFYWFPTLVASIPKIFCLLVLSHVKDSWLRGKSESMTVKQIVCVHVKHFITCSWEFLLTDNKPDTSSRVSPWP